MWHCSQQACLALTESASVVVQEGMGYGMYALVLPFLLWMIVLVVSMQKCFELLFGPMYSMLVASETVLS